MSSSAPPGSRTKILEVAEALFARDGFSGVGMRQVAASAGLGKSSLFHHFRTKGQLYYEVLGRVLERLEQRLESAAQGGGESVPLLEQLGRWLDAIVDALAEHPSSARLLLRGLFEEPQIELGTPEADRVDGILNRIVGGMQQLLGEGVESGALRPVSVPDTVQTLIGAVVYHFASGEIGERITGAPLFTAEAVRRRKRELRGLLQRALAPEPA